MPRRRADAVEAAVVTVYRHARSDAAMAAMTQDWAECRRLSAIARSIAAAYPRAAEKARFTSMAGIK